jgi:hypothetical protein
VNKASSPLPLRHLLAITALVVGSGVLVRGLWQARPRPAPTPVSVPATHVPDQPTPSPIFAVALETQVVPDAIPEVVNALENRIRAASTAMPSHRLTGADAALVAQSSSEYLRGVLSGSPNDYLSFLESHGGDPGMDLADPRNADGLRTFFESVNKNYSNGRISLEHLVVRPRVLNGVNVYQDDFGARTSMTHADQRFPELGRVAYTTPYGQEIIGDTYEVLLPIEYRADGKTTTILLGIWMTRSPSSKRWLPSRVASYAPPRTGVTIAHPVY